MRIYFFLILIEVLALAFEILSEKTPYSSINQSQSYNYGYWFKFKPLTVQKNQKRFGNKTSKMYADQKKYLISFELNVDNKLTLWQIQTDKFDHVINIVQTDGMQQYVFQPDLQEYEGRWNFFGIQVISVDQYQIIFFSNQLKIIVIDGEIKRNQQQDYYIGGYGNLMNADGSQIYFQYFKGQLTNFIELEQIVTESNFDITVLSDKQSYLDMFYKSNIQLFFQILSFDGQTVKQYSSAYYLEGIRYALSMWVKSSIEYYWQPLNYSIFRASLNDKIADTYLGDKQLFIQYQVGLVKQQNIVFAMTYSFQTPIYQFQKKNDSDWIKIQDDDLMQGLKQWHFIQFEYGRTSKPDATPPKYNSLFTLLLPKINKQFYQDWNRDNHHFTGVPIYFYLGGSLSQHENKFIGSISQFKFISQSTIDLQYLDLQSSFQCHVTCATCSGPTQSDCLTCSEEKNRVLSANQCLCQIGYINNSPLTSESFCKLISQYMIEIKETEYRCPEGYDQCEDKIVCSYGHFIQENKCYKCPLQPSEFILDINIYCIECVLGFQQNWIGRCDLNLLQLDSKVFSQSFLNSISFNSQSYNDTFQFIPIYSLSRGCEKGYGQDYQLQNCKKCQNCLVCSFQGFTQKCSECPNYHYLHENNCIQCGINCEQCDSYGCLQCQEGSFLTLDKINCNECSIKNCDYCYQYYQNSISNEIAISLDLKFNQVDLSLEGIVTGCARCQDGFAISGNNCIEHSSQSCLTGIIEDSQFQCLIGFDENTGSQFNNCNLIENCYSCFVKYPINPWCIQCVEGYYLQFEDGSCITCPTICASCIRENYNYNYTWKINVRSFYYYNFGSHLFEDFAIDTDNYQYNIKCTACKDNYILYGSTCIPGCEYNCEVCEIKNGEAVCTKCKDNQYGQVLSLDDNLKCLECPQKCQSCRTRGRNFIMELNKYFDMNQYTTNENWCQLQEKGYFMDNEFSLPVQCENSQKCFKSLILQLDIYCYDYYDPEIILSNTSCKLLRIQFCLLKIFDEQMIDYMKKQVIKELEIILEIKDQVCEASKINITEFTFIRVLSLKKTTLKLSSKNKSLIVIYSNIYLNNFTNYIISNMIFNHSGSQQLFLDGRQSEVTLEQMDITNFEPKDRGFFRFENVWFLVLNNIRIKNYMQNASQLFFIENQEMSNITIQITDLSINSFHSISNGNKGNLSRLFNITSLFDGQIKLNITNITILNSIFDKDFQFFEINFHQIKSIISNLTMENNLFSDCSFIMFENVYEQMYISMNLKNNTLNNSTLIQIPILTLENSMIFQNKLYGSSILIKSTGSFDKFSRQFNFIQLLTQKNEYCYGCQFISINQLDYQNISVYFENYSTINNLQKDFLNLKLNQDQSLIYIQSNYVFLNYFTIKRPNGTIELSIMQTQQIIIKNLTIQNDKINKIITKQLNCLPESQNLVVYIFDTKYILIDKFIINQLSAIDYSIMMIQSQSILRKEQNETIILKNGEILNNSLVVSQLNQQISVIQINSQQQQLIYIDNIRFVKNILNLYVQDLQMFSAATVLVQSDKGKIQFENLYFQQNYVINSTNSQLFIKGNFIQIRDTIFLSNNIFDLEILKNFLKLNYNDQISIEQIKLKDYPIQSNGGSGQLTASTIIIDNINIYQSFGLNGGSFYIQTLGVSYIKISDSVILNSYTSDDVNSQGGTFFIDGSKSNLQLILENIQVQYSKSRKTGGCIYLNALQLNTQITNISCTNCFSINGGFMMMDSIQDYPPSINLTRITLQNPDFRWFLENIIDMTIDEQIMFRKNSYLLYLPNSILKLDQLQITDGDCSGILFIDGKNGIVIQGMVIQEYRVFLTPLITISHPQITQNLIYIGGIHIKDVIQEQTKQYVCKNHIIQFDKSDQCSINDQILEQEMLTLFDELYKDNNFNCNYLNIHQTSEQQTAMIEVFNLTSNLVTIENININNVSYQAAYGLISLRDFSQNTKQIKINYLYIINSICGNGCMLISSSTEHLINNKRFLINNLDEVQNTSNSSVNIYNSKFIGNQAIQGSGIYIINISAMIINSQFINNTAQNFGGAIYFSGNINNLLLLNNEIINNKAESVSGSGVYLNGISMSKLGGLQNIFFDNQQDFNEIPQKLQLLLNNFILNKHIIRNDSKSFIEQVYIRPYKILGYKQLTNFITLPSGQSIKDYQYFDQFNQEYIQYNLSLRFIPINRFKQQLYDQQINLQLSARTNNGSYVNKYFNKNSFGYDNTTQSFNLDDLIIYYSPYEQSNLEVKVESQDIKIPKYSQIPPYKIESYQNYELRFVIKTFPCQLGQFYDINLQCCQQCTGNTYSVQLNSRICVFKDDNFINEVNSAKIQLKPGFWRAYVISPKIDSCYHLEKNCIGGWGTGNQLCSQGYIGALCEQCDLYNIRGNGSYSVSSLYSCRLCSDSGGNFLSVILISLWTLLSTVMTVQSTIDLVNNQIQRHKSTYSRFNYQDQKPNPAVLIKVISNYLQIIVTITTFQLKVPPEISTVIVSVGNPISSMAYSLDCSLINITDINIIYFRVIWGILLAFSYIFIFELGYLILLSQDNCKEGSKSNKYQSQLFQFLSQAILIFQPYNKGMFNKIDTQSTTVCAVSIILATTIYTAQENKLNEIIWPFYLIISILNSLFFIKLLWILLYAYAQKLENQLDALRDKIIKIFPHSVNRFPFLRTILENKQERKKRVHQRFKKLKYLLLYQARVIIDVKNQNIMLPKFREDDKRESNQNERLLTSHQNQDKIFDKDVLLNRIHTE